MKDDAERSEEDDIHEAAIGWWVRLDSESATREDRAAFQSWLAENPAHGRAFEEVRLLCAEVRAMRPATPTPAAPRKSSRFKAVAAAVVALSLLLVVCFNEVRLALRADFRTGTGELRVVQLDDGSHVHLSARSAISVNLKSGERRLTLLEGEAWFEATPDASRPFVVAANSGTVTALGTAFDIALEEQGAVVTVTEHRVAISNRGHSEFASEGQQCAIESAGSISRPKSVDTSDVTAWRRGKLIFTNRPLGEVLATLSRYHHGYILTTSPSIRQLRVTGVFDADDPLGALEVIEESLDLRAVHLTSYVVILLG